MTKVQYKVLSREKLIQLGKEEDRRRPCGTCDYINTGIFVMKRRNWKLVRVCKNTNDHYFERNALIKFEMGKDKKYHLKKL
jgi:hypothetical protein